MKITKVKETPRKIREFPVENELGLSEQQVEDVAEIFQTPLTGAYNWDYTIQDNRIKRLYELGKELNWNAGTDIDWSQPMPDRGDTPRQYFGMIINLIKICQMKISLNSFSTEVLGL